MEDRDLLPLSGVQHLVYCDRQAALIHVEQAWRENAATAEGRVLHERVDRPGGQMRRDVRLAYGLPLRSDRLGLVGRADMVELRDDPEAPRGVRPYPVEVKRGGARHPEADRAQLCAQAICLEEQFGVDVPVGALFYGESHRRVEVVFDVELRERTEALARRFHAMVRAGEVPSARYEIKKCKGCSLFDLCQPRCPGDQGRGLRYLERLIVEHVP